MKISNEVKVGILTLSALIVLIVGYNFLRGKKIFSRQQEFYSVYIDAKGILPANPVRMRGVQVGIIESITPQPDYSVLVTMSVNKGVNIPRNTVATIVSDGLLGEMAMNLALPTDTTGKLILGQYHVSGDTLKAAAEGGMMDIAMQQIVPIREKAEKVMTTLDSTLSATNAIVRSAELKHTLTNVETLTQKLQITADNANAITKDVKTFTQNDMKRLTDILANAQTMVAQLKQSTAKLDPVLDNAKKATDNLATVDFKKTVQGLDATVTELQKTLTGINTLTTSINKGEGSMGKLMTDDKLYTDLNVAVQKFSALSSDLQEQPTRYLGNILYPKRTKKMYDREAERKKKEQAGNK